jgi:recombination protein RecA
MSARSEAAAAAIIKAIGDESDHAEIQGYLDTGYPPLNERLSGDPDLGLPYGRIVEVYGDSGTGKTAWAVQMMIAAQRVGGAGILMDHERAFNKELARSNGLNVEAPYFTYRIPETFEDSTSKAMRIATIIREHKAIPADAPIVCVFDSVAAMIPMSVLYDSKTGKRREIDSMTMNDSSALSRAASNCVKIVNQEMARLNCISIFLNQIRTKIGVVYGDPTTTPGGAAWKFFATTRLELSRKLVKEGADKKVTGQIVNFHTKKNRMERPFQDIDMLLTFPEEGGAVFDTTASMLGLLVEEGKLKIKTLGNGQKRVVWTDGADYTLKAFLDKVKAENLYPSMIDLYKNGVAAPAAAPVTATSALAEV